MRRVHVVGKVQATAAALLTVVLQQGCLPADADETALESEAREARADLAHAPDSEANDEARAGRARDDHTSATRGTLAVGDSHSCTITSDGHVACWGFNRTGQLGNDTTESSAVPVRVHQLSHVVEIAAGAGGYHTCARKIDGTVACWGLSECGQLGNGATSKCGKGVVFDTFSKLPVQVLNLTDAVEIAAGQYSTCARRRGGSVVCWGINGYGGLGNGSTADSGVPVAVLGLNDAVALTVGSGHACARRRTGDVVCWGFNIDGRLGNGTTVNASTPTPVVGLRRARAITAGNYHTCAHDADDTVLCWGSGQGPLAADGQREDALRPSVVPFARRVDLLAASSVHGACATLRTGSSLCWGMPWSDVGAVDPITIPDTGKVIELHVGSAHACARRRDLSIVCWGRNNHGQLGGGASGTTVLRPMRVVGL